MIRDQERLLDRIRSIHNDIRDSVVAACETMATEQLTTVVAEDEGGDTIFAIDRISEEVLLEAFAQIAHEWPCVLVAEGLGATGQIDFTGRQHHRPGGNLRDRRSYRRHTRHHVPETGGLDSDGRRADAWHAAHARRHRDRRTDRDSAGQATPIRCTVGDRGGRGRRRALQPHRRHHAAIACHAIA